MVIKASKESKISNIDKGEKFAAPLAKRAGGTKTRPLARRNFGAQATGLSLDRRQPGTQVTVSYGQTIFAI